MCEERLGAPDPPENGEHEEKGKNADCVDLKQCSYSKLTKQYDTILTLATILSIAGLFALVSAIGGLLCSLYKSQPIYYVLIVLAVAGLIFETFSLVLFILNNKSLAHIVPMEITFNDNQRFDKLIKLASQCNNKDDQYSKIITFELDRQKNRR